MLIDCDNDDQKLLVVGLKWHPYVNIIWTPKNINSQLNISIDNTKAVVEDINKRIRATLPDLKIDL